MRLLLVEDDPAVVEWVRLVLRSEGHTIDAAGTAADGRALSQSFRYDAALVDLDLPDGNGLALVIALRAAGQDLPIIVLTGQDREEGVVACLDAGADDYVTKPVANAVLLARVRAATRRGGARSMERLAFGDITLDRQRRQVRVADRAVHLSPREFALLEHLVRHASMVVSRADLLSAVWGVNGDTHTNMVDATLSRLRQKLSPLTRTVSIVAVRGAGYVLQGIEATTGHAGDRP